MFLVRTVRSSASGRWSGLPVVFWWSLGGQRVDLFRIDTEVANGFGDA